MTEYRFQVGTVVMCNLGSKGWKLGRVIALDYQEDNWPKERVAPYQVILEETHTLIFVPEDDERYCREISEEEIKIYNRIDALASLPPDMNESTEVTENIREIESTVNPYNELECSQNSLTSQNPNYRIGRCHCCDSCPRNWSCVELYSEHYRCASRNNLKITRCDIDLGSISVGDVVNLLGANYTPCNEGFMQCPTMMRLPPGIKFSDEGTLNGVVLFDPYRTEKYTVKFVAISTVDWQDEEIGIVRLEVSFEVEGNMPTIDFDMNQFNHDQQKARDKAKSSISLLSDIWIQWEDNQLDIRTTCDRMLKELQELRKHLQKYPRLDEGRWWAHLGGFHMNVHKLLENTLFECELYMGHALTFGNDEVRKMAEQNLEGCYKKRLLESARFMWIEGIMKMMRGEWNDAAEILHLASMKQNGWGWAVNYGDIWFTESVARLIHGAETVHLNKTKEGSIQWIDEVERLLVKGATRANKDNNFGPNGHPWVSEITEALESYRLLQKGGKDTSEWLESFKLRTLYWCAQVLSGTPPFTPKLKNRLEEESVLIENLPRVIDSN